MTTEEIALSERLAKACEPFVALLDPVPSRGDFVEIAQLDGDLCEQLCDDVLSLTVGDFRELATVLSALARALSHPEPMK